MFQSPRPLRGACKPPRSRPYRCRPSISCFNPLGPCGGHARCRPAWHVGACIRVVSIPSAPAGGMQVGRGGDLTNATQGSRVSIPSAPAGGMQAPLSLEQVNTCYELAFQSPRPLRGACKPRRRVGHPRKAVRAVSIPSAPAGGMQATSSMTRSLPCRCCFNPLGPCGGHASSWASPSNPSSKAIRFNPLGPCGGHARARASPARTVTWMMTFQSPRPLRGACKASILDAVCEGIPLRFQSPRPLRGACKPHRRLRCPADRELGGCFNPLGPCGGHASAEAIWGARLIAETGFNPLGPCGGHARSIHT